MQISEETTNHPLMLQLEHSNDCDEVASHTAVVNDEGIKTALIASSVSVSEDDDEDSSCCEEQEAVEAAEAQRRRMMIGRDGIYRI